jgi:hypothetical protein
MNKNKTERRIDLIDRTAIARYGEIYIERARYLLSTDKVIEEQLNKINLRGELHG